MKRVLVPLFAGILLSAPALSAAQDARSQAAKIVQLALILMAADRSDNVNVNRDSAKEISRVIPDLTPDIADKIVAYRNRNGRFSSLLDLLRVPGMNRDVITRHRHRIVL